MRRRLHRAIVAQILLITWLARLEVCDFLGLLLTVKLALLLLVLLRHVLLDELRYKVAICAVSIGDRAEPVALERTLLDLLFGDEGSRVRRDLRDKD